MPLLPGRDLSGMRQLFGERWRESLLPEGYAELIESCSVEHYELTALTLP